MLAHPKCTDCAACEVDVEAEVCRRYLAARVAEGQTETVYEMCQDGTRWVARQRTLDSLGNCPVTDNGGPTVPRPPDTGADLPAPMLAGRLALVGAVCLAAGLVLRRRTA